VLAASWNHFYDGINTSIIVEVAEAISSRGLAKAGYDSVNLDAGVWLHARDDQGRLQPDPSKFADLAGLSAKLKDMGLGLGLYTDLATGSCGPGPGSGGHWVEDARRIAVDFGATYLKVDFCGEPNYEAGGQLQRWQAVRDALNATGKHVYLSICPRTGAPAHGTSSPYAEETFAYAAPLNWTRSDRLDTANGVLVEYINAVDGWYSDTAEGCHNARHPCGIITNIDSVARMVRPEFSAPGTFSDADMLQVCQFGSSGDAGMTRTEYETHFALWSAVFASPLVLGFDPVTVPQWCVDLVTNPSLLALHHDELRVPGRLVAQTGGLATANITSQVWARPLSNWRVLVAVLNRSPGNLTVAVDPLTAGLQPSIGAHVQNVWSNAMLPDLAPGAKLTTTVESHAVGLFVLDPIQ
jgi:alpha-galactosidase